MYITENGCSYGDSPDAGSDVRGYFVVHYGQLRVGAGYSQRFGLVHIDYATLARTRKDSFYWYRELIKAQR